MTRRKTATLNFGQRSSIITQMYEEGLADDEQARQLTILATDAELIEFARELEYEIGV